jgi:hypothetical protein
LKRAYFLLAIPVLQFVAGTAVFVVQGGFGAGQGSLDSLFVWLQLPGVLVVETGVVNSLLDLLGTHDYISVVLGPFMINTVFYSLIIGMARLAR